jgi:hypothetical protein
MPDIPDGLYGPYERLAIKICDLIEKAMDGQPPDVREKLWRMHVEDLSNWRAWWDKFGSIFKPKEEAPK